MTTKHHLVIGKYEYTVELGGDGRAWTYRRPVNPSTGKGWQARRDVVVHETHAKGMFRWCKETGAARREERAA